MKDEEQEFTFLFPDMLIGAIVTKAFIVYELDRVPSVALGDDKLRCWCKHTVIVRSVILVAVLDPRIQGIFYLNFRPFVLVRFDP